MKDIMRAELMGRQNEMLGLTSRQKVSTWKIWEYNSRVFLLGLQDFSQRKFSNYGLVLTSTDSPWSSTSSSLTSVCASVEAAKCEVWAIYIGLTNAPAVR